MLNFQTEKTLNNERYNKSGQKFHVGVVGLGLMGCSITTCLLMAGHKVIAVAPVAQIWNMQKNEFSTFRRVAERRFGRSTSRIIIFTNLNHIRRLSRCSRIVNGN